jgi:hypothetical protein
VTLFLLVVVSACFCFTAQADSSLDASTLQQLGRLEHKYFGRSFDSDSDEARTARLEKLVFGNAVEGDPAQRIQSLVAATGAGQVYQTPETSAPAPPENQANSQPQKQETYTQRQETYTSNSEEKEDSDVGSGDSYPHITNLENVILGKNFVGQRLSERLSRMEAKAFGHASTSTDFSQRTEALDTYAEQTLHKKTVPSEDDSETAGGSSTGTDQTSYPRIDALEQAILQHTYAGQPLTERLGRMERQAFGSPSNDPDLSKRTEDLETYARNKLHKNLAQPKDDSSQAPTATSQASSQAGQPAGQQDGSGKQHQFLSTVGKSLLGLAGLNTVGGGNVIGPGVGPGFGPSFGGSGRARTGQRPNNANDEDSEKKQEARPEDPIVTAATPPPADAKLISKVGWCEMQVFGKTSPQLHLGARLAQLNQQLNFAPGKSDLALMDHIGDLMKAVIAQKQPPTKSVAAGSQPLAH